MYVETLKIIARQSTSRRNLIAGYIPSNTLTAVAIAFYGLSCILFWIHFARQGKHRWMLSLTIGTTAMVVGFFGRIGCHFDPYSLGIYVFSTLFILLSPCAFLAADYVCLSQISQYLGEDVTKGCLMFPATLIVKFFVISDILTFTIQCAGGAMTASGQNNPKMGEIGEKVSMAGLSLQGASFIAFTGILLVFGYRVCKMYPNKWYQASATPQEQLPKKSWLNIFDTTPILDWRILYYAVCLTTIGLVTRSAFRIAEFSGGYRGHLYVTESYFYILDALPVWLAITVYAFIWPPRFLKHKYLFDAVTSDEHELEAPRSDTSPVGEAKSESA